MPAWGVILKEINQLKKRAPKKRDSYDIVRRKYLKKLHEHTKIDTILYASNWSQHSSINPSMLMINEDDMHGFMVAVHKLKGPKLDLIIHSPGGSAEHAESIVKYLRSKFDYIRVFIPHSALSAATMLSCSANEVVMGNHSFLGPTDPQMLIPVGPIGQNRVMAPAQAIQEQFDKAKTEVLENSKTLGVWIPILQQISPSLLIQCDNALALSKILVGKWLEEYMFVNEVNAKKKATTVAKTLSDHKKFKSHNRHISRKDAEKMGLKITHLEDDQTLQDLILSVYHATSLTFNNSSAAKIIENHLGKARVLHAKSVITPVPIDSKLKKERPKRK